MPEKSDGGSKRDIYRRREVQKWGLEKTKQALKLDSRVKNKVKNWFILMLRVRINASSWRTKLVKNCNFLWNWLKSNFPILSLAQRDVDLWGEMRPEPAAWWWVEAVELWLGKDHKSHLARKWRVITGIFNDRPAITWNCRSIWQTTYPVY